MKTWLISWTILGPQATGSTGAWGRASGWTVTCITEGWAGRETESLSFDSIMEFINEGMTAVDKAWHELLYSLCVCSLAWHCHTDSWKKQKGSPNGGITSQEMWEVGVPIQGLQNDHCCIMCSTMAAAARAAAPSFAPGCKSCLSCPWENMYFLVCAGLHVGGEEAFTCLGSSHG